VTEALIKIKTVADENQQLLNKCGNKMEGLISFVIIIFLDSKTAACKK
jgi:hypothetical protein